MEEIVPILEPFCECTEILGKEETPTGSQVFILLYNLFQTLDSHDLDSGVARDLKAMIREGLAKRFGINTDGRPNQDTVEKSPLILAWQWTHAINH